MTVVVENWPTDFICGLESKDKNRKETRWKVGRESLWKTISLSRIEKYTKHLRQLQNMEYNHI